MSIALAVFVIIIIKGFRLRRTGDYLDQQTATQVRGIFTALILMNHFLQYIIPGQYDQFYIDLRNHLDQAIVIPYLFYSGYGMMESLKRKAY